MNNNKTISCIIVDDELSSQKVLQHFVAETEVLELKQTCNNASDAFKYLQLNPKVDLLFLAYLHQLYSKTCYAMVNWRFVEN